MREDLSLKTLNDSGFPLQIAVEHEIRNSFKENQIWNIRYVEHNWINKNEDRSGFIDIALQNIAATIFPIIECKRVRDGEWIFLNSKGTPNSRRHAKVWVTQKQQGKFQRFGWQDFIITPECPEATFCAIRGQNSNDKNTLIERVGSDLLSSIEGIATEDRDLFINNDYHLSLYIPIIVTTAELKIAEFDPSKISLQNGTIEEATIKSVPFLRFRKQLTNRDVTSIVADSASSYNLEYAKQNTVFIVRAENITDFLSEINFADHNFNTYRAF